MMTLLDVFFRHLKKSSQVMVDINSGNRKKPYSYKTDQAGCFSCGFSSSPGLQQNPGDDPRIDAAKERGNRLLTSQEITGLLKYQVPLVNDPKILTILLMVQKSQKSFQTQKNLWLSCNSIFGYHHLQIKKNIPSCFFPNFFSAVGTQHRGTQLFPRGVRRHAGVQAGQRRRGHVRAGHVLGEDAQSEITSKGGLDDLRKVQTPINICQKHQMTPVISEVLY